MKSRSVSMALSSLSFARLKKGLLEAIFAAMGFALVARHRSKDVDLWRQGEINFVINYEPRSAAAYFAAEHGPSVCGMGFRVKNARRPMQPRSIGVRSLLKLLPHPWS